MWSKLSSRRRWALVILAGLASVGAVLYPRWMYLKADDLTRADIDTRRVLAAYEHSGKPDEARAWLTDRLGRDAVTTQICLTLAGWSLHHEKQFICLVDGLPLGIRSEFVEQFSTAVSQSSGDEEFRAVFRDCSSPVVNDIRGRLR